jgi:sulfite dehydrogenase
MNSPEFRLPRRDFLRRIAIAGATGAFGGISARAQDTVTFPFANGERRLVEYPQKRKMILLTSRPPQLETPFSVFNEGVITPNDAFYVRYHLANIPTAIDPDAFRVTVKGTVKSPLSLSLADLHSQFEAVEIVAVNQCSGNSRGFFQPRVGGGQSGNGAMGNARWRGVRLRDVLDKAGVAADAKQVSINGLDTPVLEKTPDFVKTLSVDHARDGEVMLAYGMNGEALPMLNGFPLRVVVPGHYGTYWVKHVNEITVLNEEFKGFWMDTAYRIPATPGACVEPGATPDVTVPIQRFNVRSFITSHVDGAAVQTGQSTVVKGIAFDGGSGIREVLFSPDGGRNWQETELGKDLGKYSFREWTIAIKPEQKGGAEWKCRAINQIGESQPFEPLWNPAGYMRNVVETVKVNAA